MLAGDVLSGPLMMSTAWAPGVTWDEISSRCHCMAWVAAGQDEGRADSSCLGNGKQSDKVASFLEHTAVSWYVAAGRMLLLSRYGGRHRVFDAS